MPDPLVRSAGSSTRRSGWGGSDTVRSAIVESSRSASRVIFAFRAASIFHLGSSSCSVCHDRAASAAIERLVPRSGSTSSGCLCQAAYRAHAHSNSCDPALRKPSPADLGLHAGRRVAGLGTHIRRHRDLQNLEISRGGRLVVAQTAGDEDRIPSLHTHLGTVLKLQVHPAA